MVNMRFNKSLILSLLIAFALTNQVYCQEEDQKEQAFKKVQSLVEFKDTVSKIDSLKQSGHKIDVNVVAIWGLFYLRILQVLSHYTILTRFYLTRLKILFI